MATNIHTAQNKGERSRIRRPPDRAVPSEASNILAQGTVAHVGFVQDGQPYVIPFTYHYDPAQPQRLYLHGSTASRTLSHLAAGAPVCVSVTLVEGLVYSRTAMNHSMNYRRAVCFGRAGLLESEQEKGVVFEAMIGRYFESPTAERAYESPPFNPLHSPAPYAVPFLYITAQPLSTCSTT